MSHLKQLVAVIDTAARKRMYGPLARAGDDMRRLKYLAADLRRFAGAPIVEAYERMMAELVQDNAGRKAVADRLVEVEDFALSYQVNGTPVAPLIDSVLSFMAAPRPVRRRMRVFLDC